MQLSMVDRPGVASIAFTFTIFLVCGFVEAANAAAGFDVTRQYRVHNAIFGNTSSLNCTNNGQLSITGNAFSPGQDWRIVPAPDGSERYRITNGLLGADWSLTVRPGNQPAMEKTDASSVYQLWSVTPIAGNVYQITRSLNGMNWGLSVGGTNNPRLELVQQADTNNQRWSLVAQDVVPIAAMVGRWAEYSLPADAPNGAFVAVGPDKSVARMENGQSNNFGTMEVSPKRFTVVHNNGQQEMFRYVAKGTVIRFFQANGAPANFYWKLAPNAIVGPNPQPKLVSTSEPLPNPPLEPANIQFANSHKEELLLYIRDKKDDSGSQYVKIPAAKSQTVQLERDAGSKVVETWWVPKPSGEVREEQREKQLEVPVRYRISVFEKYLQSLDYDARKGKKRITGENYSPRSIGMFELPPGGELKDGRIDAFRSAKRADNKGAVDDVDPNVWKSKPDDSRTDPLKKLQKSAK